MAKRHKDALAIQEGAVNPIAIINSMKAACEEIRKEEAFHGTASMTEDPALRLMVHQLAFICGIINGIEDFANRHMMNYGDCAEACREPARDSMGNRLDGQGELDEEVIEPEDQTQGDIAGVHDEREQP